MPEILGAALELQLQTMQTLELELHELPDLRFQLQQGGIVVVPTAESPVVSVCGLTGEVEIDAADVGALPADTVIPVVPQVEIDANTAARHTHGNKTVLDGVTSSKVSEWDAKRDAHENLVDTLHPTYYYTRCRGVGTTISVDVKAETSPDSTYAQFRLKTVEKLEANQPYVLSFKVSGCDGTTPKFKLLYSRSGNNSATLKSAFSLQDGLNVVSFTPSYAGTQKRIAFTNYNLTNRSAKTITLSDFKLERGTVATDYIPSEQAVAGQVKLDKWRHIQRRIYEEAVNQFPLYFVADKTIVDSTASVSEYSALQPLAVYSWARKEMSFIGNFKVKPGETVSDGDVIFTGLPPLFSGDLTIYDALSWVANGKLCSGHVKFTTANNFTRVDKEYDNSSNSSSRPTKGEAGDKILLATGGICTCTASYVAGDPETPAVWGTPSTPSNGDVVYIKNTAVYKTRVSGAWILRYTPCGVLQFEQGDGDTITIAAGTSVRFDSRPIPLATPYGAHRFPKLSETDVHNAAEWLKSVRGHYDYSNNGRWRRMVYNDSNQPFSGYGATDCAGIVHQAFRYGAGKFVPDGTKSQLGFGKVIAFARNGEYLNLSELREGDLVGYIYPDDDGRIWAVNHVAMAVDEGDGKIQLWNVSSSYGTEYFNDYKHGMIAEDKGKPLGSVSGTEITFGPQPVRGTYKSVSDSSVYIRREDFDKSSYDARIVVRWLEDYAELDSAFE